MNNHAQMNSARKQRDFDAVCSYRRWKVVMPIGAWLAIAGILFPAGLLGAEESKEKAATPAAKQAGKKDPAKKKPVPKIRPAVRRVMRAETPTSTEGNYLLVDLSEDANDNFAQAIGKAPLRVGPVPFRLPQGDKDHLSLREAQWNGWVQDFPWSHESPRPDPNRYRYRPLGLPSGVRIADMTLEKSPLQMRVTSGESGHAFVEPQVPTFTVSLTNIKHHARGPGFGVGVPRAC